MKKYPEYKDSGVDWVGNFPTQWKMKRIKYLLGLIIEKMETSSESTFKISLESIESFTGKYLDGSRAFEGPGNYFKQGDILFNKLRPYLAKVLIAPSDGVAVGELLVLRPKAQSDKDFLLYRLLSKPFISVVNGATYGAKMPRANWDLIGNLKVPVPDTSTQHSIGKYLNHKTHLIDTLIEKKQKQIDLLQEQRAAIINQAVTKGLNPNAPMKDSGIEWLGEIPEHWEIVRNKVLFKENLERSENGDEELLTVSHITGVTPRSEKDVNMFLAESLVGYKKCEPGDLIINTMWAWMGSLGITAYYGIVSPSYNVYRFRHRRNVHPDYYDYLYRTPNSISEITRYSKGIWSSRLRLYPEIFFNLYAPLPPNNEQKEIVEYLDVKNKLTDKYIKETKSIIVKLQEYRTTLISEVVTGKIDVRDEAIP